MHTLQFTKHHTYRGTDPQCRLCPDTLSCLPPCEDIQHVLTKCRGTADVRTKMIPELLNTVAKFFPLNMILDCHDHLTLSQFILDCSSPNPPRLIPTIETMLKSSEPAVTYATEFTRKE
jgi:hypothetical protein